MAPSCGTIYFQKQTLAKPFQNTILTYNMKFNCFTKKKKKKQNERIISFIWEIFEFILVSTYVVWVLGMNIKWKQINTLSLTTQK